ncbi:ABC transporter substrate-binding protein [Tropicibacter sp. R16_0]|uniref:ABC transporter substrate-binding protein n=1 Tax=Tropicibacter sp. R16_0 TaxID=2821102 RepID=UPI001ADB2D93|nr:ABC transporter substrate-binding protein [Tropicibacter sp. R16_0]MBO9453500.1 ABC transporter substrate-binding protein [Tropicibacter sp. R16_0]
MSLRLFLLGVLTALAPSVQATEHVQPQRVISMNLCTDQLAMMLAAPGQLLSVSYLALDPRASAMADKAMAVGVNHGLAEEIYLDEPDLVIVGSFSTRTTVDMLRRLGVPVVVFDPAYSLEDVRTNILRMGQVLGREEAAQTLLKDYDDGLAALTRPSSDGPRAAIYSARGWTSGAQSLSGQILEAAGLRNIADELGMERGGTLPLEQLALVDPDLVITAQPYPGHSRAEETRRHPVLMHLRARAGQAVMSDRDWVCGTPYVLNAIKELGSAREIWQGDKQ